jgi:hypothetical protein
MVILEKLFMTEIYKISLLYNIGHLSSRDTAKAVAEG